MFGSSPDQVRGGDLVKRETGRNTRNILICFMCICVIHMHNSMCNMRSVERNMEINMYSYPGR